MGSFARSFKPSPAYLSPRRRPVMPGRSLSSSSDLSLTSPGDETPDASAGPAPGTPSVEDGQHASSAVHSPRSGPIAIELPKLKRLNAAASVYTPPEPLSARGDLPGGYFPLHEDPKGRVHCPHPFHQDNGFSRRHLHADTAAMQTDRKDPHSAAFPASMAHASMPVASYLAPGFHDSPLPMGKYYPSNYEKHQRINVNRCAHPSASESLPSSVRQESHHSRPASQVPRGEAAEAEARRNMQQYQREMIAQAAMALGGSKAASRAVTSVSLGGKSRKDAWLTGHSPHKPASQRLHPLGSPCPVTPMDLEAANTGGYLEYGRKHHDILYKEAKTAMAAGHAHHVHYDTL